MKAVIRKNTLIGSTISKQELIEEIERIHKESEEKRRASKSSYAQSRQRKSTLEAPKINHKDESSMLKKINLEEPKSDRTDSARERPVQTKPVIHNRFKSVAEET